MNEYSPEALKTRSVILEWYGIEVKRNVDKH